MYGRTEYEREYFCRITALEPHKAAEPGLH